jgi:subtilisin family serine protease
MKNRIYYSGSSHNSNLVQISLLLLSILSIIIVSTFSDFLFVTAQLPSEIYTDIKNTGAIDSNNIRTISGSVSQNSPEGSQIISEYPTYEAEQGNNIVTKNNTFIVTAQGNETTLSNDINNIGTAIEDLGANFTQFANIPNTFVITIPSPAEDGSAEPSPAEESKPNTTELAEINKVINDLKTNTTFEVVNDIFVPNVLQQQVIPNGVNRVDADLSLTVSGDGGGSVDADIAIIDSGVQRDHPDLNVFKCVSFVDNPVNNTPLESCDDRKGHGTHVAGIAAAEDNDIGVVGSAPGARIWAIKVTNDQGSLESIDDMLEAINYVMRYAHEIEVVNLSLGWIGPRTEIEDAISALVNSFGKVVVVSAGNNNIDANFFTPARVPEVITVSSITDSDGICGGVGLPTTEVGVRGSPQPIHVSNPDDVISSYSNFGPSIDIAAPGSKIFSTGIQNEGNYSTKSGTSMAAPNIAGAAALFLSANPSATPSEVIGALTSRGTTPTLDNNPLVPCDGNGKGYFSSGSVYPLDDGVNFDNIPEPLEYVK